MRGYVLQSCLGRGVKGRLYAPKLHMKLRQPPASPHISPRTSYVGSPTFVPPPPSPVLFTEIFSQLNSLLTYLLLSPEL